MGWMEETLGLLGPLSPQHLNIVGYRLPARSQPAGWIAEQKVNGDGQEGGRSVAAVGEQRTTTSKKRRRLGTVTVKVTNGQSV
ncbi:hypothetical protein Ddc_05426 [Ditylenchus destructor]|nr:hypothetical protein Ddc_05426 [Ditylenchus destructor]